MHNSTRTTSRGSVGFVIALVAAFLCPANSPASSMPELTRLTPLTRNVAAPTSVAVGPEGRVYVVESSSDRLLVSAPSGAYQKVYRGFSKPVSVAATSDGKVLVGNKGRGNVEIFDLTLNSVVGELGRGLNEFLNPTGITAAADGTIYVADMKADVVKAYSADGTFLRMIGEPGNAMGQTASPIGIAINNSSAESYEIVVVDQPTVSSSTGDHAGARVQIFDVNGAFVASFSGFGVGDDLLTRPIGVSVDSVGRIYVSDSYQNLIKIFSREGQSLGIISPENKPLRTPLGLGYCTNSNRMFISSLLSKRVEIYGIDEYTTAHGEIRPEGYEENKVANAAVSSQPKPLTGTKPAPGTPVVQGNHDHSEDIEIDNQPVISNSDQSSENMPGEIASPVQDVGSSGETNSNDLPSAEVVDEDPSLSSKAALEEVDASADSDLAAESGSSQCFIQIFGRVWNY